MVCPSQPFNRLMPKGIRGPDVASAWQVLEHDDELGQEDIGHVGLGVEFDEDIEDLELGREARLEQGTISGSGTLQSPSDNLTATQADLALLEAAMSSAVHHPNVVQTYHYRTLQPQEGARVGTSSSGRVTRVRYCLKWRMHAAQADQFLIAS